MHISTKFAKAVVDSKRIAQVNRAICTECVAVNLQPAVQASPAVPTTRIITLLCIATYLQQDSSRSSAKSNADVWSAESCRPEPMARTRAKQHGAIDWASRLSTHIRLVSKHTNDSYGKVALRVENEQDLERTRALVPDGVQPRLSTSKSNADNGNMIHKVCKEVTRLPERAKMRHCGSPPRGTPLPLADGHTAWACPQYLVEFREGTLRNIEGVQEVQSHTNQALRAAADNSTSRHDCRCTLNLDYMAKWQCRCTCRSSEATVSNSLATIVAL